MPEDKLHNLRHSLAHLLAAAVLEIWPDAKPSIGPSIENGFYYDFDLPEKISENDLSKIETKMKEILPSWDSFQRIEVSPVEAKEKFAHNPYKIELIDEIAASQQPITLYRSGNFTDLCRGGHVNTPNRDIKSDAFKLDRVAGAYWRGDEKNKMLTRIYGLAFETKEELEKYVAFRDEMAKRDHRVLGPKLGLFLFHEWSPGIPFYQPKGTVVRNELEKFVREISYGPGYSEVKLPQLFDAELWKTSGHWEHFQNDMFILKVEDRDFALKPMNCPGHMILYKQGLYSYKDLPLRLAEASTLFRNELSGALGGLTRVRAFAQDDCHIFLTPEQVSDEVTELLGRIKKIYDIFGMEIGDVFLSTRPEQAMGTAEEWKKAENALGQALEKANWKYEINPGDGAFYGPKIDMQIKDALGRKWQLATIQLDFQMPKRFELEYVDSDGSRKTPIVIHRAILGSFERFLGILIEQFAGAFPVWLSPVQAIILPISEKHLDYARQTAAKLFESGIRVEIDERNESVGKKIRDAELQKIPYMLVIGDKEVKSNSVTVRKRGEKEQQSLNLDEFNDKINIEIKEKRLF